MARVEVAGWASRAPSQPILAAWSDFFIKLNIAIYLNNLTTRTALPCPCPALHATPRANGGTGRTCGLLTPPANRRQGRMMTGGRPRPRPRPRPRNGQRQVDDVLVPCRTLSGIQIPCRMIRCAGKRGLATY